VKEHPRRFENLRYPIIDSFIILAYLSPASRRRTAVLVIPPLRECLYCYITQRVWNSGPLGEGLGEEEHYRVSRIAASQLVETDFIADRPDCHTERATDGRYWITAKVRQLILKAQRRAEKRQKLANQR